MFEKLLAILPYNPSLVHQMSFYSRRMREEAAIRRVGLIFIVLTFMIQFFAVLSPPQPTLAAPSGNDMAPGIASAGEAKAHCANKDGSQTRHYGEIMEAFGISCADIGNASTVKLDDTKADYYSMGHLSYGATNPTSGRTTDQRQINIPGVNTQLYARLLRSFDSRNTTSTYTALKVKSSLTGRIFYIIIGSAYCGNLVSIGVPVLYTPPKPPKPQDVCPNKAGVQTEADQCDVCPNIAGVQTATSQCDVCPNKAGVQSSADQCDVCSNLPGVQTSTTQCDVCPNISGTQTTTTQCDVCPNLAGVQTSSTQCDVCPNIEGVQISTSECDVCPNVSGTQTSADQCDVCPNIPDVQTSTDQCDVCPNQPGVQTDVSQCVDICLYNSALSQDSPDCKPCDQSVNSQDVVACVALHKTASNITTGATNADGTTANADDVITYTLYAQNNGKAVVPGFIFQESMSDVLDYADITDMHGGTIDPAQQIVSWPAQDIAPGQTATEQITIKVKNPIPQTPTSTSDPNHFDLIMTNVYGNTINIHVPGSPVKAVETTTAALPNTGPGTSLFIAGAIVMLAGYFYSRSRLLARESELAIKETTYA